MTSLAGIALDKDVEESSGGFTVLPAGKYKACIVRDELKDNKAGTGKILVLKIQVIEGQYAQEILTDNINITNPSAQCQAIGQGTLKRICNMCQVQYPPQDTNGLMGKPMVITIGVEEFTSNTSGKPLKSNKIKKYDPPNTPIPAIAPQTAAPAQGQAQPQMAAAGGW
ncbi:MAG: hypothetical protein DRH26_00635 [Deltaproteobacteria bacterium]|nr:MAG: hypothetical protein DRH26_00635 [Deltaproteobacteria bacterium]